MPTRIPQSRAEQNDLRRQALATGLNRAARRAMRQASQATPPAVPQPQPTPQHPRSPRTPGEFSADCGELRRGEQAERPARWRS
jgi:hypothetical protein